MADGFEIGACPDRIELSTDRGVTTGLHWPNPKHPVLLFAHANGYCASAYRQALAPLSANFEVVAIDLRGHGLSRLDTKGLKEGHSWSLYSADLVSTIDAMQSSLGVPESRPLVLAGHSLGATASIYAAKALLETGRRPASRICAIEPVMFPRLFAAAPRLLQRRIMKRGNLSKAARRRRATFENRESAAQRYQTKAPFARWAPGVLKDYLADGLQPDASGRMSLSCTPKWEAMNYSMPQKGLWPIVFALGPRLAVLQADHRTSTVLPGWRERLARSGGEVSVVPGVTHLAPFENPSLMTEFINQAMAYHRI